MRGGCWFGSAGAEGWGRAVEVFGFAIVCYLFFAGTGAGLCAISATVGLLVPGSCLAHRPSAEHRALLGRPAMAGFALLVLSTLCLMADAERPEAIVHLFTGLRPSLLSLGAWLLAFEIAAGLLAAWYWMGGFRALPVFVVRCLMVACLVGAVAVMLYSALYLAGVRAVPLWHSWWLPPLFVLSALSASLALFCAMAAAGRISQAFGRLCRRLQAIDCASLALEALCAVGFLCAALTADGAGSGQAAVEGAFALVSGRWAFLWWGGFAAIGIGAPLAMEAVALRGRSGDGRALSAALCLCVLIGALSLRFTIVAAGVHPALGF